MPVTEDSLAVETFQRLEQAASADPQALADLCRDYLLEARRTLQQLSAAVAQKDAVQLCSRAHYLRGSSLVIGATVVASCCAALEQMGSNVEFRDAALLLEKTSRALDAVAAELVRRLGRAVLPAKGSAA